MKKTRYFEKSSIDSAYAGRQPPVVNKGKKPPIMAIVLLGLWILMVPSLLSYRLNKTYINVDFTAPFSSMRRGCSKTSVLGTASLDLGEKPGF
jgi:hypothetical protein